MRTHPVFIAIANALIPGAGYLIIQERVTFGALLLAGNIALVVLMAAEPAFSPTGFFQSTTAFGQAVEVLWYGLFAAAFAYDGYRIAQEKHTALTPTSPVSEA